ncbi:MAG: M50 family metallopeptidase, partial [Kiritimatiellae bacterium]|nr:M50 family metallopeptidase [Kiritimatiellia bacterium]
ILLHELAHSVTAIAFGGRVQDITLQLLGGCAMITRMPPRPWQECVMAFAGPLCSLVLACCAWVGAVQFGETVSGWTQQGSYVTEFLPNIWFELIAMLNIGLAFFNLMPAFPMDGGRMLRSGIQIFGKTKVQATEIAVLVGRSFASLWIFLALMHLLFNVTFEAPVFLPKWLAYLWDIVLGSGGIFRLLIAWMIWTSGPRELEYVRAEATNYGGWR